MVPLQPLSWGYSCSVQQGSPALQPGPPLSGFEPSPWTHALTTSLKHVPVESFLAHTYQSNLDLLENMKMLMNKRRWGSFYIKLKTKPYITFEFHLIILEKLEPAIYYSQDLWNLGKLFLDFHSSRVTTLSWLYSFTFAFEHTKLILYPSTVHITNPWISTFSRKLYIYLSQRILLQGMSRPDLTPFFSRKWFADTDQVNLLYLGPNLPNY